MPIDLAHRDFDPDTVELMDAVLVADSELAADLNNLRHLNRWFGSYRLIRHYLERLVEPGSTHHFLDLCTGSGDIPRLMVDWCRRHNVNIKVDANDFQEATLTIARSLSAEYPEISYHQRDAKDLAGEHPYTGVFCSLALHHFSATDAALILENMWKMTRGFALVADLERTLLTWWGVRFITSTVFREPMTVHDALLSVRRSFSWNEFEQMAISTGWKNIEHRRFLYGRQAMLVCR